MTEQTEQPIIPAQAIDTSSVMRCYVLLGLGMAVGFTNMQLVSTIGVCAMLAGIFWAYKIRQKNEKESLIWNHAQWMVRTFWVSSVYAVIAMLLWSSTVYSNADFSSMHEYMAMLKTGKVVPGIAEKAATEFINTNGTILRWATVGFHGPVILFVLARFVKGYRLADAGKTIDNLKTWKI
ncbi:MAG: hypothetical protein EBQ96_01135 [Proteobacteria bacterium]|nr:hypothetical protein [Pseudomonadota bacterium]